MLELLGGLRSAYFRQGLILHGLLGKEKVGLPFPLLGRGGPLSMVLLLLLSLSLSLSLAWR